MAVLDDTTRQAIRDFWMRRFGSALTKGDLRAAVDATDSWIDSSAASFNSALPAAAQAGLTAQQKTILFCAVALRRAGFREVI